MISYFAQKVKTFLNFFIILFMVLMEKFFLAKNGIKRCII